MFQDDLRSCQHQSYSQPAPKQTAACAPHLTRHWSNLVFLLPVTGGTVPGVPPLDSPPPAPAGTNSTGSPALLSRSFAARSCALLSGVLYAHAGSAAGSQISAGRVVAYCRSGPPPSPGCCSGPSRKDVSTPIKPRSLSISAGLRAALLSDSRALKWIDLVALRERKVSNLAVRARGGEPGGDGGMEVSGTEGRVRSWVRARVAEYGERGA